MDIRYILIIGLITLGLNNLEASQGTSNAMLDRQTVILKQHYAQLAQPVSELLNNQAFRNELKTSISALASKYGIPKLSKEQQINAQKLLDTSLQYIGLVINKKGEFTPAEMEILQKQSELFEPFFESLANAIGGFEKVQSMFATYLQLLLQSLQDSLTAAQQIPK